MGKLRIATILAGSLLAGAAVAQPLFLGSAEIEATDDAAMRMAIDHCTALAEEAPDADLVASFTLPAGEGDTGAQPGEPYLVLSRDGDGSFSVSEGEAPASADESAEGTMPFSLQPPEAEEQAENDGEAEDPPDLSEVTLEDCKDAGLAF